VAGAMADTALAGAEEAQAGRDTSLVSPASPVRIVTAAALFDGHDAAINVIRRVLQAHGAEVIHLGHDRSVDDVVTAALQEDADAVAVSSYQGGHVEYFRYLVDRLGEHGAGHVRVYGGGGGVIASDEIQLLHDYGVARIFSPAEGQSVGLDGMAERILEECRARREPAWLSLDALAVDAPRAVARAIRWLEERAADDPERVVARSALAARRAAPAPVIGFTGTGGAGKSSLIDETVRRFRRELPQRSVGVLLVDPTRRRSGGALLGDRMRMNAIEAPHVFVHSLATRRVHRAVSETLGDAVRVLQAAGFDLILVETAGIGQSDSEIVDFVDLSVYVMTPEYGAPSQLEKVDMLDLADLVAVNKSDRRGAEDALRDVKKQWRRNHPERAQDEPPIHATIASRWNDPGVDRFHAALSSALQPRLGGVAPRASSEVGDPRAHAIVPAQRTRYLAEVAETVRAYRARVEAQAERARDVQALERALERLSGPEARGHLERARDEARGALAPELAAALTEWPAVRARYAAPEQSYRVRGREIAVANHSTTLSGVELPAVALPRGEEWGELARYLGLENLPGRFPFTAGVFPFKRGSQEEPTRMFAGEGTPERTNRRFHLLIAGQPAARISTAFDSVTLYGRDPHPRPDVWGKVGTSGVSVCTLDDAKKLYSGIDLLDPATSVSMTINGPAPIVLAFFLNAAIDQAVERHLAASCDIDERIQSYWVRRGLPRPRYHGTRPEGHSGLGLALLGIPGEELVDEATYARIRAEVLERVRGTVQADILKEDQAQNTCIFSTEFALRLMGDIQAYFCANRVGSFYSVSISGYHIAEAGAYPITQLAFTLANAFTYVEYYLSRGLAVDEFAPNLSFFFSNGLDPEYGVIGRVARRIWAVAMRERYGASERSQKLKYHIQTSGRSLHAQEMSFNDIRTTMQAWLALADSCNSLHTNAYDEAVTTPTEESVRRAVAIQLILNREFGLLRNENPMQGAYLIEQLTDAVEEAVLREFERISERGGVLGAMETLYQRGKIQEESLRYEQLKHSGELPIVGVNTFRGEAAGGGSAARELVRSSEEERRAQLENLRAFHERHAERVGPALERLRSCARRGDNVFAELMETVKYASLGQIVDALFAVGGRYRRAM
jgi:isobutyryl-CoA mutase